MGRRSVTTTIRLDEDLHERIKRVARAERRTKNNFIAIALEDVVKQYEAEHPDLLEEGAGHGEAGRDE
jgi:predicted transcriptional regulator